MGKVSWLVATLIVLIGLGIWAAKHFKKDDLTIPESSAPVEIPEAPLAVPEKLEPETSTPVTDPSSTSGISETTGPSAPPITETTTAGPTEGGDTVDARDQTENPPVPIEPSQPVDGSSIAEKSEVGAFLVKSRLEPARDALSQSRPMIGNPFLTQSLEGKWKGRIRFPDQSYWRLRLSIDFKNEDSAPSGTMTLEMKNSNGKSIHKTTARGSLPYFRQRVGQSQETLIQLANSYAFQLIPLPTRKSIAGNFYQEESSGEVVHRGWFELEHD